MMQTKTRQDLRENRHRTLRVLMIDDCEDDAFAVREWLRRVQGSPYELKWVNDPDTGLELLLGETFDICLMDVWLGASDGLSLIRKATEAHCSTPVVVLTGVTEHTIDLEAMRAGAADFLDKAECGVERLDRALRYTLQRARLGNQAHENATSYEDLFKNMHDAVVLIEPDTGRILDANPAALTLYAMERPRMLACSYDDLKAKPPEGAPPLTDSDMQFHRDAHGRVFPVEVGLSRCKLQGRVLKSAIIREATRALQARRKLTSQARIDSAVAWLARHVLSNDGTNDIVRNMLKVACELTQCSQAAYVRLGQGDDKPLIVDLVELGKPPRHIEQPQNQHTRWLTTTHQPLLAQTAEDLAHLPTPFIDAPIQCMQTMPVILGQRLIGQIMVMNGHGECSDQTRQFLHRLGSLMMLAAERKRSSRALAQSEARYRRIFETISDVYFELTPEGLLLEASPSVHALWGRPREALLGQPIAALGLKIDEAESHLGELARHRRFSDRSVCLRGANNSVIEATVSARLIRGEQGLRIAGTLRDVTEKLRTRRQREMLEKRMEQTQRIEAIGTLAGGIAHDFNNILLTIIGFTELTIDGLPEGDPNQQNLLEVMQGAERARQLVEQLLTFSRKADQRLQPVRLSLIVKEMVKLMRSTLPSTIELRSQVAPNLGLVMGDPVRLHEMLVHLCTNAFQAMPEGGVLTLSLSPYDQPERATDGSDSLPPGRYLRLSVADTGRGIDARTQARMFEPFFTTRGNGEGTGMGLSICHGTAHAAGGTIICQSEPGRGATFHVYLPEHKPAQPAAEPTAPAGSGQRILLVDDEPSVLNFARIMIENLGYIVETARDGAEAMKRWHEAPEGFDCLLTDQTMPHMTGAQLAKALIEEQPTLPVLIMSGFSELVNESWVQSNGLRQLIHKPFHQDELARALAGALGASKPA